MRKIYERPLAEVIELNTADIITASLDTTVNRVGIGYAISGDDYTTYYNESAGGKLTLN